MRRVHTRLADIARALKARVLHRRWWIWGWP